MLKRLHLRLNEQGLIDLHTWMIDSTAVRVTRASLAPGKRGPDEPTDHALGRIRGGLTRKIDMLCDTNGTPLRFLLSGGQASDISYAQPLLDDVSIPSSQRSRPRKRCKWLLADKGYDAEALRRYCDQYRMQSVIPMRSMKRKPKPGHLDCLIGPNTDSATSSSTCWLVEREPPHRDTLRQAREKLCRHGLTGLLYAVFAASLFVQRRDSCRLRTLH